MTVDEIITQCEARPVTGERKLILALAREVKRLQGSKRRTKAQETDDRTPS